MKSLTLSILFFSMVVSLPMQCHAEDMALELDDREWKIGNNATKDKYGIYEYVLKGETVNNWSELVTVQTYFGLQEKTTPEQVMNDMIKRLKEICPNLIWNIIKKGDKDVMFDWEITNCPGQDNQYEIDRVILGGDAIWWLHYATKKLPISSDKRNEWQKLLNTSALRK